jgi:hypothetical protein
MSEIETEFNTAVATARHALEQVNAAPMVPEQARWTTGIALVSHMEGSVGDRPACRSLELRLGGVSDRAAQKRYRANES